VTCPGTISLSSAHLRYLATLLRQHRRSIGTRYRRLTPDRQALLVLAHLRNGDTYTRLAVGFAVGVATVCRYVHEAVDLLAAQAPSLTAALWQLARKGHNLGVLDGTVVRIDRVGGTPTSCTTPASTAGRECQASAGTRRPVGDTCD
jgi:hypothetical protein